jgi:hypothetical protein
VAGFAKGKSDTSTRRRSTGLVSGPHDDIHRSARRV